MVRERKGKSVYVCALECVCVCVRVQEREREREKRVFLVFLYMKVEKIFFENFFGDFSKQSPSSEEPKLNTNLALRYFFII